MRLFDSHFHYDGEVAPEEYAAPALALGEFYFMVVGGDFPESVRSVRFAEAVETAYFAAGVHPHAVERFDRGHDDFASLYCHPKARAVGEIGLDYYYDNAPRTLQRDVFAHFLDRALQVDLPVIVHLRGPDGDDAVYHEGFEMLSSFAHSGGRMVIHCFAGGVSWAEKFMELGAMIGITGMVTFKRADNIRETLRVVPDRRLLIETDAPYLAPVPNRGKVNHPAFVRYVAERIAQERGYSTEQLAEITFQNAKEFFCI